MQQAISQDMPHLRSRRFFRPDIPALLQDSFQNFFRHPEIKFVINIYVFFPAAYQGAGLPAEKALIENCLAGADYNAAVIDENMFYILSAVLHSMRRI